MSSNDDGSDANAADDDGYVHTPGGATEPAATGEPVADGFGRAGWILTGALIVCVLVIPGIIYAYPYAAGSFGMTFFATYLVLPLIPAVFLGLVAVWSMSAATADEASSTAGEASAPNDRSE